MNITLAQLKSHLIENKGWTEEEFFQFAGFYFRQIDADDNTNLPLDVWEQLANEF